MPISNLGKENITTNKGSKEQAVGLLPPWSPKISQAINHGIMNKCNLLAGFVLLQSKAIVISVSQHLPA